MKVCAVIEVYLLLHFCKSKIAMIIISLIRDLSAVSERSSIRKYIIILTEADAYYVAEPDIMNQKLQNIVPSTTPAN